MNFRNGPRLFGALLIVGMLLALTALVAVATTAPTEAQQHEDEDSEYETEISQSQRITVGSTQQVSLSPSGDEDWFAISLDADKSYSVRLKAQSVSIYPRLMGIRDAEGQLIPATAEGDTWFYHGWTTHQIFDPPMDGDYYIVAGAHAVDWFGVQSTGHYNLQVVEVASDNIPADTTTTATATVGQTRQVVVGLAGDRDWIGVALTKDHIYRVDILGSRSGDNFPVLYGIRDSEGALLPNTTKHSEKFSSHPQEDVRLFFTAPADGTYYLDVGAYPETTGDYWMTVYDATDDDFAADTTTGGEVEINGSVTGEIEKPGDVDWIKTTLTTGMEYRIDANTRHTASHWAMYPRIVAIYDKNGDKIDGISSVGTRPWGGSVDEGARSYIQPSATATYYISVSNRYSSYRSTGEYVLAITEVPVDLPADNTTTGTVADTRPVSGEVNVAHEEDWYKLDAVAGQRYRIDLVSPHTTDQGTHDPYLVGVYDPSGDLIPGTPFDNIHGHQSMQHDALEARTWFTAAETGAHYVSASGHDSGIYYLMVYEVKDDLPADTTTTGIVEVNGAVSGHIENNDRDWIKVALTKDKEYRIRVRGRWSNSPSHGTISYLYIGGIYNSSANLEAGTKVGKPWGVYLPVVNWTATSTNVFYIEVGAPEFFQGTYVLDVREVTSAQQSLNSRATGAPTISGAARVGAPLAADTSSVADADGLRSSVPSYQWLADDGNGDTDIAGATDRAHTLTSSEEGKVIRVRVSFTDDAGNDESLTSAATAAVMALQPPGRPRGLTGTVAHDVVSLTWDDPDDASITGYQILRLDRDVHWPGDFQVHVDDTGSAATAYVDWDVEPERRYVYRIKAIGAAGLSKRSDYFSADTPSAPDPAPNNPATGAPTIKGAAEVGETLTADTSGIEDADGLGNAVFSYQWMISSGAANTDITGATDSTYTPAASDVGIAIKVGVSFTDDAGHGETRTSAATEGVSFIVQQQSAANNPATGAPAISGTARVGETLTADTSGIADTDGMSGATFSYQWIAGDGTTDADITGATAATYAIASDDEGQTIKVEVSFTDDAGHEETLISSATVAVTAADPPAAPQNLAATVNEAGSVVLAWDDPEDASITGYRILRRNRDTGAIGVFTAINDDTGSAATTYVDSTVEPGTRYVYKIKAINPGGLSALSHYVSADAPAVDPPAQPQNLTATVNEAGSVVLAWDDPEDASITGYRILRRNRDTWAIGVFVAVNDDTGSAATTYADSTVEPETRYVYRIKAINPGGLSAQSHYVPADAPAVEPNANNPATGVPAISGTAQVGETLTAGTSGIEDADGLSGATFSYQWIAGDGSTDTDISGATAATYAIASDDEGKTIKVEVSFTDDAGHKETLTSAATEGVSFAVQQQGAANNPATGAPVISGTVQVGETLTADTSAIEDEDGLDDAEFSYQWLAADAEISGATGSSYTLMDADEGQTVKVNVSFTDDAGNEETLTSAATSAVAAKPNSPATGAPAISGTAQVGETLTAETSGIEDEDGLDNAAYTYQWLADDTEITGATSSSYTLAPNDEGNTIQVRVSFTDDAENEETLTSAATAAVAAAEPEPQEPPAKPTGLSGTVAHNAVSLSWDDPEDDSITGYQILRRNRAVDAPGQFQVHVEDTGSAATSHVDRDVEPDTRYVYRIKARNAGGLSGRSDYFGADIPPEPEPEPEPNSPATGLPAISGTARVGETLTADTSGIADTDGLDSAAFSYQWVATDGGAELNIGGATGAAYTLLPIDAGLRFMVRVSFTDDAGNEETLTSAATAVVAE